MHLQISNGICLRFQSLTAGKWYKQEKSQFSQFPIPAQVRASVIWAAEPSPSWQDLVCDRRRWRPVENGTMLNHLTPDLFSIVVAAVRGRPTISVQSLPCLQGCWQSVPHLPPTTQLRGEEQRGYGAGRGGGCSPVRIDPSTIPLISGGAAVAPRAGRRAGRRLTSAGPHSYRPAEWWGSQPRRRQFP